jgi:hypothetical protein
MHALESARQEAAAMEEAAIEAAGGREEWLRQQQRPSNTVCFCAMEGDPDVVVGACGHGAHQARRWASPRCVVYCGGDARC